MIYAPLFKPQASIMAYKKALFLDL